ncbi:MAG: hypothetical protein KW788_01455 [Candidatus Doudnabacteria bacterium]|nr:hypothetical protein [Candidatus Doudnabacteria bacterium]
MFRRIEVPGALFNSAMLLAADAMVESGLPGPGRRWKWQEGKSCKFFYTEYGWRRSGHKVLARIRSRGFLAKIIVVKENDRRLNIFYRDKWQVMLAWGGKK